MEVVDVIATAKKADATVIEKQSPIAEENQKLEKWKAVSEADIQ